MKKPELNRIFQTWIKIMPKKNWITADLSTIIPEIIRSKVSIFADLLREGKIDWFCFLIHEFPEDPDNFYFHIRFTKVKGKKFELPDYCSKPKIEKVGQTISGIDNSLLNDEDIGEVWKIIGEQSELIIKLVQIHKGRISIEQFVQFMHFNMNMLGLGHRSKIRIIQQGFIHRYLSF